MFSSLNCHLKLGVILLQIRNVGHYQEGVGATVGEEMEQVNGSISLYGNKTKHMTEKSMVQIIKIFKG